MRKLAPTIGWTVAGQGESAVDARVLPLLRAIADAGTLTAAAARVGVSYRSAWGILTDNARLVGAPLAVLERGRGARLAPLGEKLLAADTSARQLLEVHGHSLRLGVRGVPARVATVARLRVAASHDLVLARLRPEWRERHGVELEFHGSAEGLERYAGGDVQLAGFHMPLDGARGGGILLAQLRPDRDVLVRFLRRAQGLILPKGNPRRVRSLRDVVDRGLRFVNRQPGSGTRILVDRLLAAARIRPAAVDGYSTEEFTHAAVAATIKAGKADAGFGLQAAAAEFGLAFVPVVQESYFFACRRRSLRTDAVGAFRALLADADTRAVVARLPGYALDAPGALAELARTPGGAVRLL